MTPQRVERAGDAPVVDQVQQPPRQPVERSDIDRVVRSAADPAWDHAHPAAHRHERPLRDRRGLDHDLGRRLPCTHDQHASPEEPAPIAATSAPPLSADIDSARPPRKPTVRACENRAAPTRALIAATRPPRLPGRDAAPLRLRLETRRRASPVGWIGSSIPIGMVDHTLGYGQVDVQTRRRLSRQDWVQAALEAIAEGGLAAVAVVPLAKRLGATKGSFYWHFPTREALVLAALADWEQSHTAAVIAEIEAASDDPLQQLRLLFKRVTALAARDRIELALLATADHPTVQPVLDRVTRRRIEFAAQLFQQLGFSGAQARRRALLAYSTYLGYAQLVHATPQLLPRAQAAKRAYLNDVLTALTSPPSDRG
jgi:AcrR family transcriptional regulator